MPLLDDDAMDTSLDNDYDGIDVDVALFVGDPMNGGVEVTNVDCPGYTRFASDASERVASAAGRKRICAATFTASAAWALSPTHYQIYVGSVGWDNAPLDEPLDVTGAGSPEVLVDVFYDDSVPTD